MVTNEHQDTDSDRSEEQLYEDLAELIFDIYEDKLDEEEDEVDKV